MVKIEWSTPSKNASESMPSGGHDIGINFWVEKGEVFLYFGRGDSFDENNSLLKSGRLRIGFDQPADFISQKLDVDRGTSSITLMIQERKLVISLICSVRYSSFSLKFDSELPIRAYVSYENWRQEKKLLPNDNSRWNCKGFYKYPGEVSQYPDQIISYSNHIFFFHQNQTAAIIDETLKQQSLLEYREMVNDEISHAIFGGMMISEDLHLLGESSKTYLGTQARSTDYALMIEQTSRLDVHLLKTNNLSIDEWQAELKRHNKLYNARAEQRHSEQWWIKKSKESFIDLSSPDGKAEEMTKNYSLFRYLLLCNERGKMPTKFNGGLFTVDPIAYFLGEDNQELLDSPLKEKNQTNHVSLAKFDPDFRLWGGGIFTGQNQRLVYWPLLMTGDFEAMKSQFDFYKDNLFIAKKVVQKYWGHRGAMFAEQLENFGISSGSEYGWIDPITGKRRYGFTDFTELDSPYTRYYYGTQLEICYMILKYASYTGESISEYFDLIKDSLLFFYDHYRYLHRLTCLSDFDQNGKLVITPSTAAETYKNAVNPTDLVSGLHVTLPLFMERFSSDLSSEDMLEFQNFYQSLPNIEFRESNGYQTIAPAKTFTDIFNNELPQLYPVFPYNIYGVGRPNLTVARNTWWYGVDLESQRGTVSWHQDNIFTACLGLAEEAAELNYRKLKDSWNRFPAFWGPGYDWLPDHNWGGSGMVGLQKMLLQETDSEIFIFPACPENWEGAARLFIENQGVIHFAVNAGAISIYEYQSQKKKNIYFKGELVYV